MPKETLLLPKRWPGPRYQVKVRFDAPLNFVYGWCTDYTPNDARLEGERFERRILRRSPRQVVYEDLEEMDGGWFWTRHYVRLQPPHRWHSDTVGSHRAYLLDYTLSKLPGDRTELTLTARRSPYGVGGPNPPKIEWERSVRKSWISFRRHLEKDYRSARSKKR